MAKLEQLRVSLLDMTPEEVRERIRFVREDRRVTKKADKAPAKKREAKADKTRALIASLTPAQKKALLKSLEGK